MKKRHFCSAILLVLFLLIVMQPAPVQGLNIPGDTSIGMWDPLTRTYTLTTDVLGTIQIDEDNLTLDGAGYTVEGGGGGNGIYLPLGRTGVTVKNLNIKKFHYGIYLNRWAQWNTLTNNTASENVYGIYFRDHCDNNTLTNNTASHNNYCGIYLRGDHNNTFTNHTTSNNKYGIYIYYANNNMFVGNTASYNTSCGIFIQYSVGNTLTNNTASHNTDCGIFLYPWSRGNTLKGNTASYNNYGIYLWDHCYANTLTGNTVSNNYSHGICLNDSSNNKIYNNNFTDNPTQAYVSGSSGNIFYLAKPIGGNYWSDWTTTDNDYDGFVDYPYVFEGGQDNLPWAGHLTPTPVGENVTVDLGSGATVTFDNVTVQGSTTMTTSDTPPEGSFFITFIPAFYNIHTTATFTGNVHIEITYDDTGVEDESSLRLFKFVGTPLTPVDITDDSLIPNPDIDANKIIGMTDGFSVFAVGVPDLRISASPRILWPPNNKMRDILIQGEATDLSGKMSLEFSVLDEYGECEPDLSGFGDTIQLEAARRGYDKDGRIYTINVIATDSSGNIGSASTSVVVPHDQGML